jgi:hypothetical protein
MQLDIDPTETPAIYGDSDLAPAFEIYANEQFDTDDAKTVLPGSVELSDFRYRVICNVENEVLVIPRISGIYSTEDSKTNQLATYSAYLRVKGRDPIPWLERFRIPPLRTSMESMSWSRLRIHNQGVIARAPIDAYTKQQTNDLIALALLAFSNSTITSGLAELVDGSAVIPTQQVFATSRILAFSMDAGVTGRLRAEQSEIVDEESFRIQSTSDGDNGAIMWLLLN